MSLLACVPSPLGPGRQLHARFPVPAAERIPGEDAVVAGGVPLTGRHRKLHEPGRRAHIDTPLHRKKKSNNSRGSCNDAGKRCSSTDQRRGNDQALDGLGLVKQLKLLHDVQFSLDVYSSMQPAVVCRMRHLLC